MRVKNIIKPLSLIVMAAVALNGCADLKKSRLASGEDPEQAIVEVSKLMADGENDQHDVLADSKYLNGTKYLKEAKEYLKEEDGQNDVLLNASISKAFFKDARKIADKRKSSAGRILNARKSAINAGTRKNVALIENLDKIDDDLKSETDQFTKRLSPEDFSELQKKYLVLESKAVQYTELNAANQAIIGAVDSDAGDLAPNSLRTASLDYKTAMNIIAQSPRSPKIFKKSVNGALVSATQLFDVMNVIKGAKGTPENIAVQIVKQKRALGELSSNVGKLQANLKTTQQSLQQKEGDLKRTKGVLKTQEEQLSRASTQVRFQEAMDEAQKVLSKNDALVYQQGNKLIFRLKRINFRSGAANIPESSKDLIAKVDGIIKKLDANKVGVQGHTDSVGSAKINKKLSKGRASSVANYLFSLKGGYKITYSGFGEAHPIASNESSSGRATNRRVDLVVSVKQ